MTECERLIDQGIFHPSFFEEEERCGFLVTEERKKIWAIELDLLSQFIRVCEKYDLTYFLIGGSLLGAVRHKGIIPWDDDIDVGMPRKDYDKFLTLGFEFQSPYFLQTPRSDPGYAYSYAKIRNTETTCVVPMFQYQHFNHGIFIDVFPYENWLQEDEINIFNKIHKLAYDNSTFMRLSNPNLDERNRERVKSWPGKNYIEVYDEIQRLASQYKDIPTDKIAKVVFAFNLAQEVHNMADYKETLSVDFNNLKVKIPTGYKNILLKYFGPDYMQYPPVEQRNGGHDSAIFDPDKSYKFYLK